MLKSVPIRQEIKFIRSGQILHFLSQMFVLVSGKFDIRFIAILDSKLRPYRPESSLQSPDAGYPVMYPELDIRCISYFFPGWARTTWARCKPHSTPPPPPLQSPISRRPPCRRIRLGSTKSSLFNPHSVFEPIVYMSPIDTVCPSRVKSMLLNIQIHFNCTFPIYQVPIYILDYVKKSFCILKIFLFFSSSKLKTSYRFLFMWCNKKKEIGVD